MIKRIAVSFAALAVLLATGTPAGAAGSWPWPVDGEVITPYKNGDDPYAAGQHRGVDIAAALGAPVASSTSGTVSFAGRLPDGGITVTVRSTGGEYLISYLHLASLAVTKGAAIAQRTVVGTVGTTGKRSTEQPHLHFGVRRAASGEYVDPLPLLASRPVAQQPAAERPAIEQPSAQAAPRAQVKSRAEIETRRPAARPHVQVDRERGVEQRKSHNVHAQSEGDSVAAQLPNARSGSARESHASHGNGRVAPPPLQMPSDLEAPAAAASSQPSRANASIARREAGRGRGVGITVLAIVAIAAGLLLLRRRGLARGDMPPLGAAIRQPPGAVPAASPPVSALRPSGERLGQR